MTKRELVVDVAERLGYTQNEVASVVQATLDAIIEALAEGKRLEIRNFGVFEVKTRHARSGRNPRTGQEVPIAKKRVSTFKPGKALKERVQGGVLETPVGQADDEYAASASALAGGAARPSEPAQADLSGPSASDEPGPGGQETLL